MAHQRPDPHRLRLSMQDIAASSPAEALGLADLDPAGSSITGPRKASWIDEALRQKHRVAMDLLPIGGQPPQGQSQHPRRQVGDPGPRQNQEARIVDYQRQTLALYRLRPANPAVAAATLKSRRTPAHQGNPRALPLGHVA